MSKKPKLGSVELRGRNGKPFALFGTFALAVKAIMKSGVVYAAMFECVELMGERKFELCCEYEVAE
jgi:hypothetical protein